MNYGMYLSAVGALNSLYKQDLYANNLANSNTVGFKPDVAMSRQRLPERLESPGAMTDPQYMLEKLGGGLLGHPNRINLSQGNLVNSGNDLDVAVRGEGFLVLGDPADPNERLLTRDGRLSLNGQGQLIHSANGMPVLDVNDLPIQLNGTAGVDINADGQIIQNDQRVAQLQVVAPSDPTQLRKVGHSLLRVDVNSNATLLPGSGDILQGHIESSGTDPIMTLNDMITATKSMKANSTLMQYHDHVLGQAVNTFGRLS